MLASLNSFAHFLLLRHGRRERKESREEKICDGTEVRGAHSAQFYVTVFLLLTGARSAQAQNAGSRKLLVRYRYNFRKNDNFIFWIKLTARNCQIRKERGCNDFLLFLLALNRRKNSTQLRNNNYNILKTHMFLLRQVGAVWYINE